MPSRGPGALVLVLPLPGADSKEGIGTASTADASASAKLWVRCCSWESKKSAWREWWQLGNCQWLGI